VTTTEFMFQQANWKIPKLEVGELVRFNYWNSNLDDWYGVRGIVVKIRYLSAKPLKYKTGQIIRGNIQYTVVTSSGVRSFYNQRMCNLEKIQKKS